MSYIFYSPKHDINPGDIETFIFDSIQNDKIAYEKDSEFWVNKYLEIVFETEEHGFNVYDFLVNGYRHADEEAKKIVLNGLIETVDYLADEMSQEQKDKWYLPVIEQVA